MDLVLQTLLSWLYSNEREECEIPLEEVVLDVFPHWNEMGARVKEEVTKKVQRVIATAASKDVLKRYIEYRDRKVRFRIPNYKNTRALQAFEKAGALYISNVKREYVQETLEKWDEDVGN